MLPVAVKSLQVSLFAEQRQPLSARWQCCHSFIHWFIHSFSINTKISLQWCSKLLSSVGTWFRAYKSTLLMLICYCVFSCFYFIMNLGCGWLDLLNWCKYQSLLLLLFHLHPYLLPPLCSCVFYRSSCSPSSPLLVISSHTPYQTIENKSEVFIL